MDKYKLVLQIFSILLILFVIYTFVKLVILYVKEKRITKYALDIDGSRDSGIIFGLIYKFSDFLNSLIIFDTVGDKYNKYVYTGSRLRKGMDFIAIKILVGVLNILIYLFTVMLYKNDVSMLLLLTSFILGFLIPDFYINIVRREKISALDDSVLRFIVILKNGIKSKYGLKEALEKVISEFPNLYLYQVALNDLNLGKEPYEAIYRIYLRSNNKSFLYLARLYVMKNKSNVDMLYGLELLEKNLLSKDKFHNRILYIKHINKITLLVFIFLPIFFIVSLIVNNNYYIELLTGYMGTIIVGIIFILYFFYLLLIHGIYRRCDNE